MSNKSAREPANGGVDHYRRRFLKGLGAAATAAAGAGKVRMAWGGKSLEDALADFFQKHYQRMTPEELQETLRRIERKASQQHGVDITCTDTPPLPGVVFGYAAMVDGLIDKLCPDT